MLDAEIIKSFSQSENMNLILLDEVDSTNSYAKRLLDDGLPDGTLIIANYQSAGRGRNGHDFFSPRGSGLYFTYVMRNGHRTRGNARATIAAGVAAAEAIERCSNSHPRIKWVNDVFVERRKVAGILCEATGEATIIGIGINWHPVTFPREISDSAGCVEGTRTSRSELAGVLYARLRHWLERLSDAELLEEYRRRSLLIGRRIRFEAKGVVEEATATSIDDEGYLIVVMPDGSSKTLVVGEVRVSEWDTPLSPEYRR